MKLSETEILGFQKEMSTSGFNLTLDESQRQAQTLTKLFEIIMKYED